MATVRLGSAAIHFLGQTANLVQSVRRAGSSLRSFSQSLNRYRGVVNRVNRSAGRFVSNTLSIRNAVGLLTGGAGLGLLVRQQAQFGASLDATSRRLGVSVENLQLFRRVLSEEAGQSIQTTDLGLQRFIRRMAEANAGNILLRRTFQNLGVSLTDNEGNLRDSVEVLLEYADAIAAIPDQQNRILNTYRLFDIEAVGFVNVLSQGREALVKLLMEQERFGVVTTSQAQRLAALDTSFSRLTESFRTGLAQGVASSADEFERLNQIFIDRIPEIVPQLIKFSEAGIQFFSYIVDNARTILTILAAVKGATVGSSLGALFGGPLGAAIGAVIGGTGAAIGTNIAIDRFTGTGAGTTGAGSAAPSTSFPEDSEGRFTGNLISVPGQGIQETNFLRDIEQQLQRQQTLLQQRVMLIERGSQIIDPQQEGLFELQNMLHERELELIERINIARDKGQSDRLSLLEVDLEVFRDQRDAQLENLQAFIGQNAALRQQVSNLESVDQIMNQVNMAVHQQTLELENQRRILEASPGQRASVQRQIDVENILTRKRIELEGQLQQAIRSGSQSSIQNIQSRIMAFNLLDQKVRGQIQLSLDYNATLDMQNQLIADNQAKILQVSQSIAGSFTSFTGSLARDFTLASDQIEDRSRQLEKRAREFAVSILEIIQQALIYDVLAQGIASAIGAGLGALGGGGWLHSTPARPRSIWI